MSTPVSGILRDFVKESFGVWVLSLVRVRLGSSRFVFGSGLRCTRVQTGTGDERDGGEDFVRSRTKLREGPTEGVSFTLTS